MSSNKEKMVIETECQEGICPICGSDLEYNGHEDIDDGGVYHWNCPGCGATGQEGFDFVFDGNHYKVFTADGTPVEIRTPDVAEMTPERNDAQKESLAISIIKAFEDLLEEHGIIVPDDDRPDDNDTPLYGCTYGDLRDAIVDLLVTAQ